MSSSPPIAQKNSSSEAKEDCRDYLRTGRCKYGASCKYNHPANVQSGGGMKAPLNPSEPLFPVRPNEPTCQYYMKHGTCKFGQACKFNHPPQSQLASSGSGPAVAGRKNDASPVLWNHADPKVAGLPQRPGEPNCLFFQKNGRCKYGATCRYHHPLNYHERRPASNSEDQRRMDSSPKVVRYVSSLPPGTYQPGHLVVADGLTFLSVDGSTPSHVLPVSQGNQETIIYTGVPSNVGNRPLVNSREVMASSSNVSIASSYDTANSHVDYGGGMGDSSSSLWHRTNRSNSTASLGAYSLSDGSGRQHMVSGGRTLMVPNLSDSMSLPRVASTSSSASENGSMYYDANNGLTRHSSVPTMVGTSWRGRRANSFDHAGQGSYHGREDNGDRAPQPRIHEGQRSPMVRGRPVPGGKRRAPQVGEVDDGISMMTSHLLTMLDTTEEGVMEGYDTYYDEQSGYSSQTSTPLLNPENPNNMGDVSPNTPGDARVYQAGPMPSPSQYYYTKEDMGSGHMNVLAPPQMTSAPREEDYMSWQGRTSHFERPYQGNVRTFSVSEAQQQSSYQQGSQNVGLYLP